MPAQASQLGDLLQRGFATAEASVTSPAAARHVARPHPKQPAPKTPAPEAQDEDDTSQDVPAPPMWLLFGLAATGLIWGRRISAARHKG